MVYSVRAKLAVRITARSAVRRPPTTLKTPTACMPEPRGPEVRERRAVIVSTMSACLKAAVARWTRGHAAAGLDGMTTPRGRPMVVFGRGSRFGSEPGSGTLVYFRYTFHLPCMYLPWSCLVLCALTSCQVYPQSQAVPRFGRRQAGLRPARRRERRFTAGSRLVLSCGLCRRGQGCCPASRRLNLAAGPGVSRCSRALGLYCLRALMSIVSYGSSRRHP
jgi:hypothetical protein